MLTELVAARLGHLSEDEQEVLEYVTFAEPISLNVLQRLVPAAAIETVEARKLIAVQPDGLRRQVRLAHPLYGEVTMRACPYLRRVRHLRELASALARTGLRRNGDALRLAVWWLESDAPGDPAVLLRAGRDALAVLDIPLATQLGWAAHRAGGGVAAGAWLTGVLNLAGEHERAAAVSREVPEPDDDAGLTALAEARLQVHGLGLGQIDKVRETYTEVIGRLRSPSHRARITAVYAYQLAVQLDCRTAADLPEPEADPVLAAYVAHAKTTGLVHLGRYREAAELAERVLAVVEEWRDARPMAVLGLEVDRHTAMLLSGDLATAERRIVADHERAVADQLWHGWTSLRIMCRARSARFAGHVREALRLALVAYDSMPAAYRDVTLGEVALAAALCGDGDTAAQAVRAGTDEPPSNGYRIMTFWAELARPWVAALRSDLATAVRAGLAVATWPARTTCPHSS
ncbi:hypothetical protein Acor_74010 [Acrocarpospora corrugata]|uniref:Uncharacterized protein n=1 Tax=Acrocarpospora corrugata TaxID=35763 RepID=A0A5M3WDZ9_9ACTN|nr:hypothetical protein [Acrocarpospora corrugata]GES05333.1 hypothetical protein Acor_74010 [Acrocarpospora corrugata]